jgi:hypothetical protein
VDEARRRGNVPPKGEGNIKRGKYLFPGRRIWGWLPGIIGNMGGILEEIDRYRRACKSGKSFGEQLRQDIDPNSKYINTPFGFIPNPYYNPYRL